MKQMGKCYFRYFTIAIKTLHEYKVNWLVSFIKIPIILVLYWSVWRAIFDYHGGAIGGYQFNDMMVYFVVVQWIAFVLPSGISDQIASDINSGKISAFLSRPVSYIPSRIAYYFAHWVLNSLIGFAPFILALNCFGDFKGTLIIPAQFILLTFGSFCVHMLLESCIGSTAFWLQKVFGLQYLLMTVFNIFGGRVLPVSLFPKWCNIFINMSPVRAMYSGPIDFLLGGSFYEAFYLQVLWVALLSVALKLLWSRGQYIYEAAG